MSIELEQDRRRRVFDMALRVWDGRDAAKFLTLFTSALEFLRALVDTPKEAPIWMRPGFALRN